MRSTVDLSKAAYVIIKSDVAKLLQFEKKTKKLAKFRTFFRTHGKVAITRWVN